MFSRARRYPIPSFRNSLDVGLRKNVLRLKQVDKITFRLLLRRTEKLIFLPRTSKIFPGSLASWMFFRVEKSLVNAISKCRPTSTKGWARCQNARTIQHRGFGPLVSSTLSPKKTTTQPQRHSTTNILVDCTSVHVLHHYIIFNHIALTSVTFNNKMSFNNNNNNNNNNEERKHSIVEDAPAFHSVAMMSAPTAVPLRSAATESYSKQSFRVNEHPALLSISDKKQAMAPAVGGALATTTPWKVSKPLAIPSYYMLERTHACVSGASAEEVSERIANFLRTESIAATFDNQQVRSHSSPITL